MGLFAPNTEYCCLFLTLQFFENLQDKTQLPVRFCWPRLEKCITLRRVETTVTTKIRNRLTQINLSRLYISNSFKQFSLFEPLN